MKIFLFFLIFIVNSSYSQVENNFVPIISIAYSCKSQATLNAGFNNGSPITAYKIIWKRNGISITNQPQSNYLRVTAYGNYSFEVIYGDDERKESNNLILNEFSETGFVAAYRPGSLLFYARNDTIFCANNTVTFESNVISKVKYTYYLNDKIVENQESNLFNNIDKLNIYKLNFKVKDSLCIYKSKDFIFSNEYTSNPKSKIENLTFCNGETAKIPSSIKIIYVNDVLSLKSEWFKNDTLFSTNISHIELAKTNLVTNESGLYYSKSTLKMGNGEFILYSGKINVAFKNEITIPKSNFTRRLCPASPELSCELLNLEIASVSWFQDFTEIPSNLVSIDTITSNSTKVNLNSSGNYYLKVNYLNGCETTSENIPFDFENRIQINSLIKKDFFCKNELLSLEDFEEYRNIEFNLFWKLDNEIQVNKLANKNIFSVEKPGNYQLTARHSAGTCILNSYVVKIDFAQINDNLNFIDSMQLCTGKSIKLRLSDSTSIILNWYRDNTKLDLNQKELEITEGGNYYAIFNALNCSEYSLSTSKPLKISEVNLPTATISGTNNIDYNQTTDLKFELTSAPPWQIKLNTGEEFSINESPYTLKVRPLTDMKYSISSIENICGLGVATGEALIKVTILADENTVEENANLKVFPIPVADVFELELLETNSKNAQIILINNMGVELQNHFTKSINNQINKTLNINYLPAGIYNLKVKIGSKIYTRKIVKQ